MKINININSVLFELFLTIILIALKLDGALQASWIWVVSPLWIAILINMLSTIIVAIIISFEQKKYNKPLVAQGKPLVWDAKTQTMYGPFDEDESWL